MAKAKVTEASNIKLNSSNKPEFNDINIKGIEQKAEIIMPAFGAPSLVI